MNKNFNLIESNIVTSTGKYIQDVHSRNKQWTNIQKYFELYISYNKKMEKVESGKSFAVFSINIPFVIKL